MGRIFFLPFFTNFKGRRDFMDIIVKNKEDIRKQGRYAFFAPCDKGSAKPSFCSPRHLEELKARRDSIKRTIEAGFVQSPQRMNTLKADYKKMDERASMIEENAIRAKKIYQEDQPYYDARRKELAKIITAKTPSKRAKKAGEVSAYRVIEQENAGFADEKLEYQVLQSLADENPDIAPLEK